MLWVWINLYMSIVQVLNARFRARDVADLSEKSAWVVFMFASKDDQVPLRFGGSQIIAYRPIRKTKEEGYDGELCADAVKGERVFGSWKVLELEPTKKVRMRDDFYHPPVSKALNA